MSSIQKTLSIALCLATTLIYSEAFARDDQNSCPSVTHVQRTIVERADQSMESLRSYVSRTNSVYRLDMNDVKQSLDGWRAAIACEEQVAQSPAKIEVASKAADEGNR